MEKHLKENVTSHRVNSKEESSCLIIYRVSWLQVTNVANKILSLLHEEIKHAIMRKWK